MDLAVEVHGMTSVCESELRLEGTGDGGPFRCRSRDTTAPRCGGFYRSRCVRGATSPSPWALRAALSPERGEGQHRLRKERVHSDLRGFDHEKIRRGDGFALSPSRGEGGAQRPG